MPLTASENQNESQRVQVLSMAFLEYLADMSEVDGKLIGPQDIPSNKCINQQQPLTRHEDKKENSEIDNSEQKAFEPTKKTEEECKSHD